MRAPDDHIALALAALAPDRCIMVGDLAEATGLDGRDLLMALTDLVKAGMAERTEVGCFTLTRAGATHRASGRPVAAMRHPRPPRPEAPPPPPGKQASPLVARLWSAMRMRRAGFTADDLVQLALTDAETVNAAYVATTKYLRALLAARYVRELPRRAGAAKRFTLLKDTGPLAPVARRVGSVGEPSSLTDPNTGETIALAPASSRPARAAGGAA